MRCPLVKQYGIATYLEFTMADEDFLYRPTEAGLDIVDALTMWTWIRFHPESTGLRVNYFAKWDSDPVWDRSYVLNKSGGGTDILEFNITEDGHVIVGIGDAEANYATGVWLFVAGRFISSTELALFVGEARSGRFNWYRNVAGIPASIWISTQNLQIGGADDGYPYEGQTTYYLDGDMSLFGLANRALTDIYIQNLFSQSRPLFV